MRHRAWAVGCLFLALAALAAPRPARGDALDEIQRRGKLIWGADEEGGGPYVFSGRGGERQGFEVDLAAMLAAELGVKAEFQPGQWENLPDLLNGTIDVVLNGYEWTPDRAARYRCTRPYYQFGLQLLAPRTGRIKTWDDLAVDHKDKPLTIGVLGGSSAETYLKEHFPHVDAKSYDGNTNAMDQAEHGAIDGTIQDDPIAVFYSDRFPHLAFIGRPAEGGVYVAMVGPDEKRLQEKLNQALVKIIDDGRLKKLYDRWDLSGRAQMLALRDEPTTEQIEAGGGARNGWEIVRENLVLLLKAAGMTVLLSVISMPLAIAIGILIAIGRLYGPWPIAKLLGLYVEVLRGTPLMLQLYAIFFLLPHLSLYPNPLVAAISALAINYSAYEAEIYRAGLQAIPRGQMEAALSLGMSTPLAIRRIILPQAFRIVIPPVTNDFIALFKDTSVCSVVTVVELTKQYNILANNTGAIVELALVTAVLYMMMSYPLSLFARWSERRLAGI